MEDAEISEIAKLLWEAPYAVLSHDTTEDPVRCENAYDTVGCCSHILLTLWLCCLLGLMHSQHLHSIIWLVIASHVSLPWLNTHRTYRHAHVTAQPAAAVRICIVRGGTTAPPLCYASPNEHWNKL